MSRDTKIAVIEIGANHINEHAELLQIVQPTHVLVTNNGQDHLEGFGSIEGVRIANGEIFEWAKQHNAEIFVNKDIADLIEDSKGGKVILYPEKEFLSISEITAGGKYNNTIIKSNLFGSFNEQNILASIVVGEYFKVPLLDIADAITEYQPTLKRSQIIKQDNYTLIMDCYNANPSSMELSLRDLFQSFNNLEKIIIIGDMFELGEQSKKFHQEVLEFIGDKVKSNDTVICIGVDFSFYKEKFPFNFFRTTLDAKVFFETINKTGKVVFMKGSRGIKLEDILNKK
jgi:UDP-N-acetylmuramoyl-tripeptide--D-alanyl-D-alanine ligase